MSNHNQKLAFIISAILLISVLTPSLTAFASAASSPSWTVDRPPYAGGTRTITYTTNASNHQSSSDGVAGISLFAQPETYNVYTPAENMPDAPPAEYIPLDIGIIANARQAMRRSAQLNPGYAWSSAPDGSGGWLPTYTQYYKDTVAGFESGPTGITSDNSGRWFQLPFLFKFYGVSYGWVWVCSNGYLSFESNCTSPTPPDFNNTAAPNAIVAGLWRHLDPSRSANPSTAIRYYSGYWQWLGAQEVFVVTWDNVMDVSSNAPQTFQIVLFQGNSLGSNIVDDDIYIQYNSITTDTPSFVGVISPDASEAVSFPVNLLPAGHQCYLYIPFLPYQSTLGSISTPGSITHVSLSFQKAPGDTLAELDNPQVQAYNVVLDPNDLYNPIPLLVWGAQSLLGACTFGAALMSVESTRALTVAQAAIIQYKDAYSILTSGMSLANKLFGLEMASYALSPVTKTYTLVTSQSLWGKLSVFRKFVTNEIITDPSVQQSVWLWALGNPAMGMSGFNDPTSSQAVLNGYVGVPQTLLAASDMGLAMRVLWAFNDVPNHVMNHRLTITATIQYNYGYSSGGLGYSATNYLTTSVVLTEICERDPPTISAPSSSIQCVVGTGFTWTASDASPDSYTIVRRPAGSTGAWETVCEGVPWSGGAITCSIADLPVGSHYTYQCTVYDVEGLSNQCTVDVAVVSDTFPPTIDKPPNRIIAPWSTGNVPITWHPDDDNPSYWYIYKGSSIANFSYAWKKGDVITQKIDNLPEGTYVYNLVAYDKYGYWQNSSVTVYVKSPNIFVAITDPISGTYYDTTSTSVSISFTIDVRTDPYNSPPTISCAQIEAGDGWLWSTGWVTANYAYSTAGGHNYYTYSLSLSSGDPTKTYFIIARASTDGGQTYVSSPLNGLGTITVYVHQKQPPAICFTNPSGDTTMAGPVSYTFHVSASDSELGASGITSVEMYCTDLNGPGYVPVLYPATHGSGSDWYRTFSLYPITTFEIGAKATDVTGLSRWATVHVTVTKVPISSIAITSPASGSNYETSGSSMSIEFDVNIACSSYNPSDSTNIVQVWANGQWYAEYYAYSPSAGNYLYYRSVSLPATDPKATYYIQARASEDNGATWIYSGTITVYVHKYTPPPGGGGGGGGGCPYLFVYNGSEYYNEGLLDIHTGYNGTDLVVSHVLGPELQAVHGMYLLRLTEHWSTLSHINQVNLYATLSNGMTIQLPLLSATHSQLGNVLPQLRYDDDRSVTLLGAMRNNGTSQSIDLRFLALPEFVHVVSFTFVIVGYNPVVTQ